MDLVSHIYKLTQGSSDILGVCGVAIKTSDIVVDWVLGAAIPGPADPAQGFLDDDVFAGVKTLALAIAILATFIDCCRACLHGILPSNKSDWGVNNSTLYKARAYVYSGIADSVIDDGLKASLPPYGSSSCQTQTWIGRFWVSTLPRPYSGCYMFCTW